MSFNSFHFLLFFPLVTVLYFLIPHKFRYLWLLAASYYFYMSWSVRYAGLILTSTLITYASGILIQRAGDNAKLKKLWVGLSVGSNLAILFNYKYINFAIDTINDLFAGTGFSAIENVSVTLPVGISFYTFQALSYTMDVYRNEVEVERNPLRYALFVSFFPQLVAGPIERSKNLLSQLKERHYFDYNRAKSGLALMLYGLFLKLVIADRLAMLVDEVFNYPGHYLGLHFVVAIMCFGIQIYCDFGSYSLIAQGAAKVMGFRLMDNFRQPFFSTSISELWRRWHISLSTWFRDYLYFPLGGSRKGKFRKYLNIMIVFLASGLWHGADWSFAVWGLLHGAFQVIGEISKPVKERITDFFGIERKRFSYRLGQGIITFLLFHFALIFFRAQSYESAIEVIERMFMVWNPIMFIDGSLWELGLNKANFLLVLLAIFVMTLVSIAEYKGINIWDRMVKQGFLFQWSIYLLLIFSVIIFGVYGPGYDESVFIYFQF